MRAWPQNAVVVGQVAWHVSPQQWRSVMLLYHVAALVHRKLCHIEDGPPHRDKSTKWVNAVRTSVFRVNATRLKVLEAHWEHLTSGDAPLSLRLSPCKRVARALYVSY